MYFPATIGADEFPDIRYFQPLYIWSAITKQYTPIKTIKVKF
jgi:hypothetical protein